MSKLHKNTALFFSFLFFVLSISKENYGILLSQRNLYPGYESINSFTPVEMPDLFISTRNEVNLFSSVKDLPIPDFKNQINDSYTNRLSTAKTDLIMNAEFLSNPERICRNLPCTDIVFPFHSFW
jgi:hypothetical protein